jgi:hypothetical protein
VSREFEKSLFRVPALVAERIVLVKNLFLSGIE